MLPDPSVAPNDSPAGVLTEPVPLSGTAATVHHRLLITSINTQLLRQQYNGAKHITQTARCILVDAFWSMHSNDSTNKHPTGCEPQLA